jgi:hypothetical protein
MRIVEYRLTLKLFILVRATDFLRWVIRHTVQSTALKEPLCMLESGKMRIQFVWDVTLQ